MPDTYTIHIVNESADTETFWCFLAKPEELTDDAGVYANSSASVTVESNMPGDNKFVIPVQYVVGAGASNKAVGLSVQVDTSVTNDATLLDVWSADYADAPPNMGPTMSKTGTGSPPKTISIVSNKFKKVENENKKWFANQSFGILTEAGFVGMSWSPEPQKTRVLTPKLTFYVATGDFGSNQLADWNDFSNDAATIEVPGNFKYGECTVTLTSDGSFVVTQGPPALQALFRNLDFFRSPLHHELAALALLDSGAMTMDTLKSVHFNARTEAVGGALLTGTITVGTALTAAFSYFILSGVYFTIDRAAAGGTSFSFSYSGPRSVDAVKALFQAGAQLSFGGKKGG